MVAKRTKAVTLMLSQEELLVVKEVAARCRQDVSNWLRCAAALGLEHCSQKRSEVVLVADNLWGSTASGTWKERAPREPTVVPAKDGVTDG